MRRNFPFLTVALMIGAGGLASAQSLPPDGTSLPSARPQAPEVTLLPAAGQLPVPPAPPRPLPTVPLAPPSYSPAPPPSVYVPGPPPMAYPPTPTWTAPPTDPLFPQSGPPQVLRSRGAIRESVDDRFWVGAGLLLGFGDKSAPPSPWVVPATGATVNLNGRRNTPFGAGLVLETGWWFGPERKWAVDASFLTLDTWQRWRDPNLVSSLVSNYRAAVADIDGRYSSADVNLRHRLYAGDALNVDGLIGYRYARLNDTGWIDSVIPTPDGGIIIYSDKAHATTTFNGAQVGLAASYRIGRWTLDAVGKVAFGNAHLRADFTGDSANAIRLGAPGNIPGLNQTNFAVLPTAGFTLGRDIRGRSRISVGYNFQYLGSAARAADVFQAVGVPWGTGVADNRAYWVQGVTLGWQWRY